MTPADTAELLATVQAFTGRTVGQIDVAAWHQTLGDLDLDQCRAAVTSHYRDRTDWIMPAHVRTLVRVARADRLARTVEAAPDADPDDPASYCRALRAGRVRIADGAPGILSVKALA